MDGALTLDGIELPDHLGQTPGAQGGKQDDAQQAEGIRAEEGIEDAGHIPVGNAGILGGGQAAEGGHESALAAQNGGDDRHDAEEHDDSLDEIIDRGGHVAAHDNVDGGEHGHDDDADGIVNVEGHPEQAAESVIQRGCIGDHKDEDNNGGGDLQGPGAEAFLEEVRHGGAGQMLRHDAGAPAENPPGQQGADEGVADAHPGGGDTELPAELAGVAHEDDGGKIGGAVGEGGKPGAHASPAQDETVDVGGMPAAVETHIDHYTEKDQQHTEFEREFTE